MGTRKEPEAAGSGRVRVGQYRLSRGGVWRDVPDDRDASLVLVFGCREAIAELATGSLLRTTFPTAVIAGCSTAGNIRGTHTDDGHTIVTTVRLEHSRVRGAIAAFGAGERAAGIALASSLRAPDLAHVLVLSEGIGVNGTQLVAGLREILGDTTVSGGLAGDGERMQKTLVMLDQRVESGVAVGIGFYGDRMRSGFGCQGGWRAFGPVRTITRSTDNVLHELDGESALELYRRYLGAEGDGLPASGLMFPVEIRPPMGGTPTVRTLLGVDPVAGTMRFAGDMPEGYLARLMTASTTNLLEGAATAAAESGGQHQAPELAIVVSCVGRRMVLGQRTEHELDAVGDALPQVPLAGFYSYGELAPSRGAGCDLHNQTMTLTTLYEAR